MSNVWWPEGTNDPAFQVQRDPYGEILGGDYVRARSGGITTLPQTALRYNTQAKGWAALADRTLMAVRPYNYSTMEIIWGWPKDLEGTWLEVALVRSAFGRPVTVNDGVTVFRGTREAMTVTFSEDPEAENPSINGPVIYDRPLTGGFWYYYAVFFKTTPLDWVPGYSASSPLPKNYGHAEHLWNHLPPWYQYTDNQQRTDDGHLRQFLRLFGFELDLTREYVEQWQKLYHIDFCPMRLLRRLGENFNVPYESGLGDIRYRGLVGNIAKLYAERGTSKGLDHVIEAASQYQCATTTGDNIMLTPEDSEFLTGTGRWAAYHPAMQRLDVPLLDDTSYHNTPEETVLTVADTTVTPPPEGEGRGVMEFHAEGSGALANLAICCGCGIKTLPGPPDGQGDYLPVETEILPIYGGIAVATAGILYGFSVWVMEEDCKDTTIGMMWFGPGGQAEDLLGFAESAPDTPDPGEWMHFTIQAAAPLADEEENLPRATYLVPYVRVENTIYGASVFLAGAAVYEPAKGITNAVPFAPDKFLTLGDPTEFLGTDAGSGGGKVLGQPGGS